MRPDRRCSVARVLVVAGALGFVGSALVAGCGGRSSLDEEIDDAGLDAARPTRDASPDMRHPFIDGSLPDRWTPPPPDTSPVCPTTCDDGVSCTVDSCDPKTFTCAHRPDDSLCPNGLKCDGIRGCAEIVYAITSSGVLFEVTLPSAALRRIGSATSRAGDIALTPYGTLYGISTNLTVLDRIDGTVKDTIVLQELGGIVALDSASDGTLYGGISYQERVVRIDPKTGAVSTAAYL